VQWQRDLHRSHFKWSLPKQHAVRLDHGLRDDLYGPQHDRLPVRLQVRGRE
jgi:hypothetical protein